MAYVVTQGTKTAAGVVNYNPNTGQKLSTGQSVTVNQGGNTYGAVNTGGHAPSGTTGGGTPAPTRTVTKVTPSQYGNITTYSDGTISLAPKAGIKPAAGASITGQNVPVTGGGINVATAGSQTGVNRNLTMGSSGSDVKSLQNFLINQGYSIPAGATGYYGNQTKSAVASWQAKTGLDISASPNGQADAGNFGPISRAALAKSMPPSSADQLNPIGNFNLPSSVTPGIGGINDASASIAGSKTNLDVLAQQRADQITAEKSKTAQPETQSLLDRLIHGKTPEQVAQDAFAQTGINPASYFAEQKAKIAEIESLNVKYNETEAAMNGEINKSTDSMATTGYISREQAAITRRYAPTLNMMSANINAKTATLKAMEGNFAEAENFVQKAVQNATATQEYNYNVYKTFQSANQDAFDQLDAPYKEAYSSALKIAESQLTQAKTDKNNIAKMMIDPDTAGAGINITDSYETALQKAQNYMVAHPKKSSGSIPQYQQVQEAYQTINNYLQPGKKMADGTPFIDANGFITPKAWQAIRNTTAGLLSTKDLISQYKQYFYKDKLEAYGLTDSDLQ